MSAPLADDVALNQTYAHALARRLVRPLLGTPVRPNHLTLLRVLIGAAACLLLGVGREPYLACSGVLWVIACVLDRADGELARLGDMRSASGKVLDFYSDMVLDAGWFLAAGFGIRQGWLGGAAVVLGALTGISMLLCIGLSEWYERLSVPGVKAFYGSQRFHPDDALFLLALFTWLHWLTPLLMLAGVCTPIVAAVIAVRLAALRVRRQNRTRARVVFKWAAGVLPLLLVVAAVEYRPGRAARVVSGLTAHNLCSAVFTSRLDPDSTFRELVQPMVPPLVAHLIRYRIDTEAAAVTATLAGLANATARFVPGYGCRLQYPDNLSAPTMRPADPAIVDDFAPATAVASDDPLILAALDRVFVERADEPTKDVKAVVVVRNGRVIAERYAPGFTIATPLLSYSVAKSFTNALLALLVLDGRLSVAQPIAAPEWSQAGDSRAKITVEDLMRMTSGLDAEETGSGFDPAAQMLLTESHMAAYAAARPLKQPPATHWEYTSANTLILDRLLGQTVGGGAPGLRDFAQRRLFEPLRMRNVTLEFDGAGVFVGSSYVYASARDYARFGELYLNEGLAANGRRILPEGWVQWSKRSTLGAPYGAGFWTNDGGSATAAWRIRHGFPRDGFFASGNLGQRIYIVPSQGVVIARFGYSRGPDFGIEDDLALIDAALHANHTS